MNVWRVEANLKEIFSRSDFITNRSLFSPSVLLSGRFVQNSWIWHKAGLVWPWLSRQFSLCGLQTRRMCRQRRASNSVCSVLLRFGIVHQNKTSLETATAPSACSRSERLGKMMCETRDENIFSTSVCHAYFRKKETEKYLWSPQLLSELEEEGKEKKANQIFTFFFHWGEFLANACHDWIGSLTVSQQRGHLIGQSVSD